MDGGRNLDLGLVGNCAVSALIDRRGTVVWSCFPRFDGDPVFCRRGDEGGERGFFAVDFPEVRHVEQRYLPNTAVLETVLRDANGSGLRLLDFMPRFEHFERMFRPTMLVRCLEPIGEAPRIRIRLRPVFDWGRVAPQLTRGSNHVRYVGPQETLRLTTDLPVTYVVGETFFHLERPAAMILGPDESLTRGVRDVTRDFLERTVDYWKRLSRRLHVPVDWQEAVIRSAITLKLCSYEETGAIVAAHTTSIPEIPGTERNWDYRYCWLRDAFFVVRTLNRLGYIETMEDYIDYLVNIVSASPDGHLQPVYGIGLEQRLEERVMEHLAGFRGNRPVRVGNDAWTHDQHDGYGSVILAVIQAFFDLRLERPGGLRLFHLLERVGERAKRVWNTPDAGLWEYRGRRRVHTYSAVMCWAACDRLARIATRLGREDRAAYWRDAAGEIRRAVEREAWNERRRSFVAAFGADDLDASLLLMEPIGFLRADDPRYVATVEAIGRELAAGPFVHRYVAADDFGEPVNAFLACSFWYITALARTGRVEEARARFETLLACRNHLGLLSEHVDPVTRELWGNFPQTYSHVGLIGCAHGLSRRWRDVL